MHIVIDARIINSSTGRYVERLLHYLQDIDKKNHYTILVPSKDIDYFKPKRDNFSIVAADFKNYSFAEQTKFKTFLDKLSPDLVHFCMPQQPIFYKGKKVTTMHDLTLLKTYNSDKNWFVFHVKQLIGRYVFKKIATTNDHIIAISKNTQKEYIQFSDINPSKISVIYEATDLEKSKPVLYKSPFKHFILYVGSQSDYKNIKRLGKAHQNLLKKYPDLGLMLVGSKNEMTKKNEKYFEDNNFKNIIFTGFVSNNELSWLYQNCIAYVFPSLMEGFGLPGLEAMSCGAPVASSSTTCLPEIYEDAAHYFDPTNIDDISRAVDDIITDKKLRKRLILNGFKQIKKYSWKTMAEQTHRIYLQVLKKK